MDSSSWINREDVDFDSVDSIAPLQEWELIEHVPSGECPDYPTKITKFSQLRNLTLFFPDNFGREETKITYIGLRGEWTPVVELT